MLKECECKPNVNPCTDPKKCAACMAYAEAGGSGIPNECMWGVLCTIFNRINSPNSPGGACEVVSQGNGLQYNPYNCVCNGKASNQKYCKCCNGELTGAELDEYNAALALATNFDPQSCSNFGATHFNAAGQSSWAAGEPKCKKLSYPSCTQFDFYKCT